MRNKFLTVTVIFLMCTVLLAGCGKDKDNSDISDKLKEKAAAASEKEEEEKTTDPSKNRALKEDEPEEEVIRGVPELLLFRQNAYEWGEDNTAAIEHHYTYLMLDGESAKSNRALAASLEDARDEILSKQSEAWEKDLKSIEENELIIFDESWKVYLRRADEEYLSFVTEYCGEGLFDDGAYTEYTAHTYRVDGGKEIALSEVIADEDAFYDLLSKKMYESINSKLRQYYSTDIADDKETFKDDLKDYMKSGELAWTLDPFGVTCYLQAYIKSPFAESAVIQFSEDTKHTIFTDEFRDSAKDEYVIQVPGYVGSYIDINDSGVPVYVNASEFYDYSETYDDMELSGMHLSCAGDWKNIPMTMPGGTDYYNIFLIHKDGSTVVLESHDEYDTSFINTCKLARHEVEEADSIRGCLEWASEKDYDIDGEGYTPVYVPSNPSGIRVLTGDGDYAQDWSPAVINVDTKGNIEVSTDTADNFNPKYLVGGDYDCSGLSADMGLVRSWPFEVTGDPVKLTSDLQRKLNVFLSNFSEQNFTAGTWPLDYAHFALEWSKINDPSLISIKNNRYRISHSDLNGILQKYMKTNLQEGDFDDIEEDNPYQGTSEYDEGKIWYTEPAADGEMYKNNRFSVVKDVQKVTAGRSVVYRAEFEVFSLDTDEYDKNGISKKYYALGPDEADKLMNSGKLYHTSYGLAFLRDGGEDGYSLEYYNVFGD